MNDINNFPYGYDGLRRFYEHRGFMLINDYDFVRRQSNVCYEKSNVCYEKATYAPKKATYATKNRLKRKDNIMKQELIEKICGKDSTPLTAEALAAFADEACAGIVNIRDKAEVDTDLAAKYPPKETMPVIHGKWIWNENGYDWGLGAFVCSECKCVNHNLPDNRYNPYMFMGSRYCPNCGAKMDESL